MIAIMAALCLGAFATSITLWMTGFAATGGGAAERLSRLRGLDEPLGQSSEGSGIGLRKRASVSFGGINLVSANLISNWSISLQRAGLTLNAREYFVLRVVVGLAFAALILVLSPVPILAIVGVPLGFFLVGIWLKRRINSRRQKLEKQLPELLMMLSSGLRAGFGLLQALEASGEQMTAPISMEIRRTMRDTAMGASVEQSLQSLNERVGSADFDIVITAIMIQRTVGGNLAEILENVAHTMRERERIRGEIRTLTSQQRLTGYVIGGIPVGLLIVFMLMSPEFTGQLFTEPLGRIMLGAATVMELLGFFVISKIVNIEV